MNIADHMPRHAAIDDANRAALAALRKHGPPTTCAVRACAILSEEIGEAAEQALKATSSNLAEVGLSPDTHVLNPNFEMTLRQRHIENLRSELCQIAGYALLQIHAIDTGRLIAKNQEQP